MEATGNRKIKEAYERVEWMRTFFWTGCLSYLLIGLAHVIMGSLLPEILAYYGKDYGDGGLLISLQFAGFLIGVLSGPWCAQKLGKRGALLLCLFCLSAAQLVFFSLPVWGLMLAIAPLAGFGFGMVETIIGALVIQHMEGSQKTSSMTRLEVFFGLGALLMPLLSSMLMAIGWWRGAFLCLSVLSTVVFVLWWLLPLGKMEGLMSRQSGVRERSAEARSRVRMSRTSWRLLTLFLLVFALYVGTEMSVANFLPSILIANVGVTPEIGALGVTCFWAAITVGRLFAAQLAERLGKSRYLLLSSSGGAMILAGFTMSDGAAASFTLIMLLGLVMSGMFAVALVYANEFFQGREERITSMLIAAGGVGGALVPLLTGGLMERLSIQQALWVLVLFYVLMLILVLQASRVGEGKGDPSV
ncbi:MULTISPECIES: MFS transporter [unclassified Paenibacillus]|uniref:MFS transporter n=1 Tax=unclassified Paenibacillus TaxID=185978 RepID=UPI001AEBA29E|nr:FHS family glucose/mannose:H+ symporter-like MFS transporter [Paenibacillus sp. PvP091]MBP1169937.1 FHS family glucose/mannose:H+ symporter-like MFS transporter [Paenibacillus sp. PvR098]MBP2440965.1 FHS family glucose/mannose:H+ symporter-like MFS transporter [Paenibacillus sp. PvP052]